MNILNKALLNGLVGIVIVTATGSVIARGGRMATVNTDSTVLTDETILTDGVVLDYNEQTHLEFMREEEKLARDVYMELGAMYPDHPIFGRIDDSEQQHTDAVRAMIEK